MAKKTKGLPPSVTGAATPVPAAPRRKLKNSRKAKGKAVVAPSAAPAARTKPQGKAKKAPGKSVVGGTLVARAASLVGALAPVVKRARKPVRPPAPLGRLERLEIALNEVRIGARASVRTRKLLASGVPKMAQKVIEEAAEAAIEAIRGDKSAFVLESVDLFYNLLALASEIGVPLAAIFAEMDRREQTLGMVEKLPKLPDV